MSIEDSIKLLKTEIEEIFLSQNVHPNIIDLRNKAFSAHAIVESLIETSISNRLIFLAHRDVEVSNEILNVSKGFAKIMTPVFQSMRFYSKAQFAQKIGATDSDTHAAITKLNNIRNNLAHPHTRDCKEYITKQGYEKALKDIKEALSQAYANDGVIFGDVTYDLFPEQ